MADIAIACSIDNRPWPGGQLAMALYPSRMPGPAEAAGRAVREPVGCQP
jgi:hypothetical protein